MYMTKDEVLSLIESNKILQKDWYVIKTRTWITASKLKLYKESKELFFRKYVLESQVTYEKEEWKHFTIWTAFDYFLSYWEEKFYEKYIIDKWLLKPWLVAECERLWLDSSWTVDVLKERLFWNKIILSKADWNLILSMLNEYFRQPMFKPKDPSFKYQVEAKVKFKNLMLYWTFDRKSSELLELRDFKTSWDIKWFIWNIDTYWYLFSMSFYYWLNLLAFDEDSEIYLDVLHKWTPSASRIIKIPKNKIKDTFDNEIIPLLNQLSEDMKNWEETYDFSIWTKWNNRLELFWCEYYDQMDCTIMTEEDIEILS